MTYAYIRVSTNYQTVQNQKLAIREYARYHRLHKIPMGSRNNQWYQESGKTKTREASRISQHGRHNHSHRAFTTWTFPHDDSERPAIASGKKVLR